MSTIPGCPRPNRYIAARVACMPIFLVATVLLGMGISRIPNSAWSHRAVIALPMFVPIFSILFALFDIFVLDNTNATLALSIDTILWPLGFIPTIILLVEVCKIICALKGAALPKMRGALAMLVVGCVFAVGAYGVEVGCWVYNAFLVDKGKKEEKKEGEGEAV